MTAGVVQKLEIGQRVKVLEPFRPIRFGRIIGVDQERIPIFSLLQIEIESKVCRPEDPSIIPLQPQTITWVAARHCCLLETNDRV